MNTFTIAATSVGVILTTLGAHFWGRKRRSSTQDAGARNDLVFDEMFSVVKHFFVKASMHTVEEMQAFGNNWVPAPFDVRVIKVSVPVSTRIEAGKILIDTLGEEEVQTVLGGREWWQRTASKTGAIDGEWISMKKDWSGLDTEENTGGDAESRIKDANAKLRSMKAEAKAREKRAWKEGKAREAKRDKEAADGANSDIEPPSSAGASQQEEGGADAEETYSPELDDMSCILYIHGGAYFFGSINTHRYSIWRLARKTRGRAFAINYRLAPQYPFPCALSDALASYLYLIRPPPGAKHRAIDPAKITISGDSAGGGLCLALLCLIRDSGLPPPAGAMLLSPWCDLTHSFPSILANTATDIIPPYGFLFKPSTLWPPPARAFQKRADMSTSLPILRAAQDAKRSSSLFSLRKFEHTKAPQVVLEPEAPQITNEPEEMDDFAAHLTVVVDGKVTEVPDQIQLYATNQQLTYPFVSPVWMPSLGGLPPLYILAGDKEVLRDEIIYMAHRAANPAAYPLRQALLDANPARAKRALSYAPTKVHLQVYDDCPHDLPLFSFTTPAKFAYRAISAFATFVTSEKSSPTQTEKASLSVPGIDKTIYSPILPFHRPEYVDNMIRERVGIDGVIRPLEPVEELPILHLDPNTIGIVKEEPVKRYLKGKSEWDLKYAKTYEEVQRQRERHLMKSVKEESERILRRETQKGKSGKSKLEVPKPSGSTILAEVPERMESAIVGIWELHGERPPPSSIAARKDTKEARKLARVLDTHYDRIHALHLWNEVAGVAHPHRSGTL